MITGVLNQSKVKMYLLQERKERKREREQSFLQENIQKGNTKLVACELDIRINNSPEDWIQKQNIRVWHVCRL